MDGFGAHSSSPAELQRRIAFEARGEPFVVFRDGDGGEQLLALGTRRATIGRGPAVDLALDADHEVSRLHAEIEPIGGACVLCDDGLSSNGSYVNGERVSGRRKLRDGDTLRFGSTAVLFRAPGEDQLGETRPAKDLPVPGLSPTQRLVLLALCRPYREGGTYARPATNRQIADEVFLGPDAVKTHMRALFRKLGVDDFPQIATSAALLDVVIRMKLLPVVNRARSADAPYSQLAPRERAVIPPLWGPVAPRRTRRPQLM